MKQKVIPSSSFSSKEFFKFAVVGGTNTLIHLTVLFILVDFFEVWYITASLCAFLFAVTNSFILNTRWTFKQNIKHKTKERYTKFFIVSAIAALLNLALLYLFTDIFGIWYMLSQIITIAFTLVINFFGNKLWTYR